MNLLEFSEVSYCVGKKALLEGIDLSLIRGEFLGILGPNGAGKSTLLKLMNATLKPTKGRASLFGKDLGSLSHRDRMGLLKRIAVVPQFMDFNPMIPLTAEEVVQIARAGTRGILHSLTSEDHAIIRDALERLGMEDMANRTYRSLSGGERQKVQLARALAQQPDLLLLDEPTSGLDMDWQERLVNIIQELFSALGISIIMTTHITGHLPPCCGRVVLLREGKILFDGASENALKEERLGQLFHCEVDVIERAGRRHCFGAGIET